MSDEQRTIGLGGAVGIGVGAIVGGGILALAGVAFTATGPAAIVAFSLNGVIAVLTALSFAEMASKFPQSGGTYTFAKKVLSVDAAFLVGWVVWFASVVAGVLYAVGFGQFAAVVLTDLAAIAGRDTPALLRGPRAAQVLALAATAVYTLTLARRQGGGGAWINIGKTVVFGVLIAGGGWAATRLSGAEVAGQLRPFFSRGFGGLIQAMGFTFIALQGFDLIAAVAGEIRKPARNLPRAMLGSLGIALGIYLPLLLVICLVGVPVGGSISEASASAPETIVARAANHFLGGFGYWLVMVAGLLSMLSALQANLFAASRIAQAMARDRSLPRALARPHPVRGTPAAAVLLTGALIGLVVLLLPNVAAAGAASSLIFLVTFALAHWISMLVRMRSRALPPPFRVPLFPAVPILGGVACLALAVFQGIAVPSAGFIAVLWMVLGFTVFVVLFARRARVLDELAAARDPEIQQLRGRNPVVLVPVAHPESAGALIALAGMLAPTAKGRVLIHNVVVVPPNWKPSEDRGPIERIREVAGAAIHRMHETDVRAELLTTIASDPWNEIARVAHSHRCDSVLVGLSSLGETQEGEVAATGTPLDSLLGQLDADVVTLRARPGWRPAQVKRVLVPVAGKPAHLRLLARILGSFDRRGELHVTWLTVISPDAMASDRLLARRQLAHLASDLTPGLSTPLVIASDDAAGTIVDQAEEADLVVLGTQRLRRRDRIMGSFPLRIARAVDTPLVVISSR